MKFRRISGALGAEITGIDLTQDLSDDAVKNIRDIFLKHNVIFLRNQPLTSQQFMNFARAMGTPIEYPFVKGFEDFPEIIEVKKLEHEKVNFGGVWHSDTTYLECPPMGSMAVTHCLLVNTPPTKRCQTPCNA